MLLAACGSKRPPAPVVPVPERAATGAEPLLAFLPPGPDAVAELDLARLRQNGSAGMVLESVPHRHVQGFDPVRDVDLAVAAVYDLGGEQAATLFILRGAGLATATVVDATRIDAQTLVIGPAALRERAAGKGPRAPLDPGFLTLRASAMPSKAKGAAVRVTAALSAKARVATAGRLGVDEAPASISLWMDVADDAALVAILGGDDGADARRLALGVDSWRQLLEHWIPSSVLERMVVNVKGRTARLVWVVPPRRLEAWAKELTEKLGGES